MAFAVAVCFGLDFTLRHPTPDFQFAFVAFIRKEKVLRPSRLTFHFCTKSFFI